MFVLRCSVLILCSALCFGSLPKFLVLNDGDDIRLIDTPSVGPNSTPNYTVLVERLQHSNSMDAAIDDKLIFYVNNKDELTMLPVERPQDSQVLLRNIFISPESLSVDWVTKKFYWSDIETNRIEVLSYEKQPYLRKVLIYENLNGVRGLFVDPIHGYIFYNNYEDGPTIERAWMDGSHRETIITLEDGIPNALTVDYADGKIYWTDYASKEINSAKLDGTERRLVIGMLDTPYSLVVNDNFLFWSDFHKPGIFWCKKYLCDKPQKLLTDVKPKVLRVYNKTRQMKRQNPCAENNGGCSHLCLLIPLPPYKSCDCPTGIRLLDDNSSCPNGPSLTLLVARRTDLRMISLDTPDYTDTIIRVKNTKYADAAALDYDPTEGFAYWSDNELKEIRRIRLNGSDEQIVIVSEIEKCDGLAVDWIARNLYWTDSGTDRIEVARLDGVARRVLVWQDIASPRAIVLDPVGGYMYWSDWDERMPKIEKAFLDGTNRTSLVNFDTNGKHWPNGLALDASRRFLYYADAKADEIWRINVINGLERKLIISQDLHHVFGLSILGEYIYWSDWQRRSLTRAKTVDGSSKVMLHDDLAGLMGIKAVNLSYKPTEMNECGIKNGGCSHLCLFRPVPLGKICVCPVGFELSTDRRTCVVPEAFLIYTQVDTRDIMRISLSNFPPNLDPLRLHNVSKPLAMDYNFHRNKIYWAGTEGSHGIISSAFLNGSQMTTLIDTGTFYVEGLAVDWVAENLYWSDSHYGQIEVSRLTGRSRRIIIWQDAFPRTLVVHPGAGYLYWADWNLHRYTIQRSELSGNERVTFLSDVGRVMSMTIDYAAGKLYLASNGELNERNAVYVADLNVRSRQILVSEEKMNPYAITFFSDHLYWADYDKQSIEVSNKYTGRNRTTLHANLPFLINLMAVHPLKQKGWNQCATKIKICEHLCFYSPSIANRNGHESAKCACPSHYTLEANGLNCRPPASFVLFSQNTTIQRIKTKDISDQSDYPVIILPFLSSYVHSLNYDPVNRTIIWLTTSVSDKDERKYDLILHRAKEAEKNFIIENNIKFLTSEYVKPFNLTYDPYSRTIFWINEATNSINASRFVDDGHLKHFGAIVQDSDYKPRFLTIDSKRRSLFFTNDASTGSIVRCRLDGAECKTLIYEVGQVQAIAVDPHRGTLFWADSNSGSIKKIDSDGRNRVTVELKSNVWPISMAVFRDRLFFIDSSSKLVESIDKDVGGEIRRELNQGLPSLSKLLAVDEQISNEIAKSPCRTSICSHLCLLPVTSQSTYDCACPINMAWGVQEKTCINLKICKKSEWRCDNGLQCVDRFNLCDGKWDCFDKSDEINEICKTCRSHEYFPCESNRTCIHRSKYCDSHYDCPDRSDELCKCPENFDCKNMMGHDFPIYCIKKDLMCDGVNDCDGGVDEKHCTNGRNWYGRSPDGAISSSTPNDNSPQSIIIALSIIIVGFFAIFAIIFIVKCTRDKRQQHLHFNVVNQQGSSVDGQTITTTVVEMELSSLSRLATPRSKTTPRSIAVSSVFSQRPDLTGKSSSSSDYAPNQRFYESSGSNGDGRPCRMPYNPPPSPASSFNGVEQRSSSAAARSSTTRHKRRRRTGSVPKNNRRRGGYNRHGQKILYKDFRDPSPPPPYSPCSTDVNRSDYEEYSEEPILPSQCPASEPLINPPRPPPPSPTSTDHSSYAGCSTKQNSGDKHRKAQAPPPSPVSKKSYRTSTNRVQYNNPPPSPNPNISGSSSSC